YLNVDVAVSGDSLRVNGSQSLETLIAEVLRDVRDPLQNRSLWNVVMDRAWTRSRGAWSAANRLRRLRGEPARPFEFDMPALGSGSDYSAFLDHLGVPSTDMRFEGVAGVYHSMYDDFEYMDRVVDPGYLHHMAMTDVWTRTACRLAEAPVLPLRY